MTLSRSRSLLPAATGARHGRAAVRVVGGVAAVLGAAACGEPRPATAPPVAYRPGMIWDAPAPVRWIGRPASRAEAAAPPERVDEAWVDDAPTGVSDAVRSDLPPLLIPADGNAVPLAGAVAGSAAVSLDGGVIYVDGRDAAGAPLLAAFDLSARRWRWSVAVDCRARVIAAGGPVCIDDGAGARLGLDAASGAILWQQGGAGAAIDAGGDAAILASDGRAVVIDARDGRTLHGLGNAPLEGKTAVAIARGGAGDDHAAAVATPVIVTVEDGSLVGRVPVLGGVPAWVLGVRGEVARLAVAGARVVAVLASGEAYLIDPASGAALAAAAFSSRWQVAGDLLVDLASRDDEQVLRGFDARGAERLRAGYLVPAPATLVPRDDSATTPLGVLHARASAPGDAPDADRRTILVVDSATGVVTHRVGFPPRAVAAFIATVDGQAQVAFVLDRPLAVALFAVAPARSASAP